MKKYLVTVPYIVWVNVEVEADNEEEAKDIACDCSQLNICSDNKSVVVNAQGVTIEATEVCEDIYAEELEGSEEDNEVE